MRVLVCGGRNYANRTRLTAVLEDIHYDYGIDSIIEGGATGADKLASQWANERGISVITVPADRLDAACVVPHDFQRERVREKVMASEPPLQQEMTDRNQDQPTGRRNTIGTAASSSKNSAGTTRNAAQEGQDQGQDVDFTSSLPSCRCLLCPCTLCCEASISCALTGLVGAADMVYPPSAFGSFRYRTKAQRGEEHLTTAKIVRALLTSSTKDVVAGFVVEEVPAHMRER